MLYAALSRGRNTYFFTKDFLRGYPYKLKKELNLSGTFLKWQLSHQYTITNSIIVSIYSFLVSGLKLTHTVVVVALFDIISSCFALICQELTESYNYLIAECLSQIVKSGHHSH